MWKYVVPFVAAATLLFGFGACATGNVAPEEDLDGGGPSVDAASDTAAPIPIAYSVGGTVTGLVGAGLVLQNDGADDLSVNADGAFTFATSVANGKPYNITVKTQPANPGQTCTVTNGTGTVANASVSTVTVTCVANKYTVGGVVNGMTGSGLVLLNNGAGDLAITANGPFSFATPQDDGSKFAVSVKTDPTNPEQTCFVAGATGTIAGGNVTTVNVNCSKKKYTIGGNVSGLAGSGLVLLNSNGDELPISANGGFAFGVPLEDLAAYSVTVKTQPTNKWQTCTVTNGSGNVAGGPITGIAVSCTNNMYKVKATVVGLSGMGLVLRNNGGNDLAIPSNGTFEFTQTVASGSAYAVTTFASPSNPSQTCVVTGGSGTMAGADVTATVNCAANQYTIGGTLSGLQGGETVVLVNNGGSDLSLSANGSFTFGATVASGAAYSVTVKTQPSSNRECVVANGAGTVMNSAVANVTVTCGPPCRTVSGQRWCKDFVKGRGCNTFCTAIGLGNPTISDGAWTAAQDTVGECTALASAFGISTPISVGGYTYACAEVRDTPDFACSTAASCPSNHRTGADTVGVQYSVCPCGNAVTTACGVGFEETANDVATVTCPNGSVIQSITFASYGLPSGNCGGFATTSCNSANSRSVVEAACLGKNSCSVQAANPVFGPDPCVGQNKTLKIQASCQ